MTLITVASSSSETSVQALPLNLGGYFPRRGQDRGFIPLPGGNVGRTPPEVQPILLAFQRRFSFTEK